MSKRWIAFSASGLVILAGVFIFLTRGFNLGIDFTGGTMVEVSFVKGMSIKELRSGLSKVGQGDAIIQKAEGSDRKYFIKAFQKPDRFRWKRITNRWSTRSERPERACRAAAPYRRELKDDRTSTTPPNRR
jgi:preprotein translocase subunit SecF